MDIILIILAFAFTLIAILGSVLPLLPGPPLAYLALWLARWSGYCELSNSFMAWLSVVTIVVFVIDYFLPPLITKSAGGSKYATWGSITGMMFGIIFTPIGMVFGMLLGAFIGEIAFAKKSTDKALKAAAGAFAGFILGTGLKLVFCSFILYTIIASIN